MNFIKSRTLTINHSDHVVCLAVLMKTPLLTGRIIQSKFGMSIQVEKLKR